MSSAQPLMQDDNGDSRQSQGNQELIAEIIQQNAMKELTTVEMTLEFWPGLMILFSIAFGPTFIALTITEVFTLNSQ